MINVLERPEQNHTLESLAAAAGMSRTGFGDRFREVFSQSPNEFVQDLRMKAAPHNDRSADQSRCSQRRLFQPQLFLAGLPGCIRDGSIGLSKR